MHTLPILSNPVLQVSLPHHLMCPHWIKGSSYCSASVMTFMIDVHRKATLCSTDDHDRCPLFLANALRGHARKQNSLQE